MTLYLNSIFLQATGASSVPDPMAMLSGMTSLEALLLVIGLLVFFAGGYTILNLGMESMKLERLRIVQELSPEQIQALGPDAVVATIPWWKQLYDKLTDYVPQEQEADILLDHDYDGVRELDNNLPPWWKGVFYLAIAFAPVYIYFNHYSDFATSSREAYVQEMDTAEEEVKAYLATQQNAVDESNVTVLADAADIGQGGTLYRAKCAVCHGQVGEGGIGPNLTDEYWLHGGSIADVFKTIKDGVPDKGMIAWKNDLRPRDIQVVASFILSLNGTDPPNAKEPQGDKFVPVDPEVPEEMATKK